MMKAHWKTTAGGAFAKVVSNMDRVLGTTSECGYVATCAGSSKRLMESTEGKRIWLAAFNYNTIPEARIQDLEGPDMLVAISDFCAKTMQKHTKKPVFKINMGVDTAIYKPESGHRSTVFRFLCPCSDESYGKSKIVEAWKLAHKNMPNAELIIKDHSGITPEEKNALEAIPRCKVIEPLGWCLTEEGQARLYNSAYCLLYPIRSTASSLTALEAMACRIPVITTDYSAMPEIVDKITGWLVPVDLVKDEQGFEYGTPKIDYLVEAMLEAYKTKSNIKGVKAHEKVSKGWTWYHSADQLSQAMEKHFGKAR